MLTGSSQNGIGSALEDAKPRLPEGPAPHSAEEMEPFKPPFLVQGGAPSFTCWALWLSQKRKLTQVQQRSLRASFNSFIYIVLYINISL